MKIQTASHQQQAPSRAYNHAPPGHCLWQPGALINARRRRSGSSHERLWPAYARRWGAAPPAASVATASSTGTDRPAISVRGLQLSFPTRTGRAHVLQGVDLDVPRGTLHMLLGSNGCGKSTLLRLLGGLLTPDGGQLHVDAPSAFVFQNPDHQVVMPTVAADVAFGLGRYDLPAEAVQAAVRHSLQQVGLLDCAERPTSTLSGGQKQRVAIAGALAESPRVLLLDELTTFLDYEDQLNVLQCVRSIVDSGEPVSASSDSDSEPEQLRQQSAARRSGHRGMGAGGHSDRSRESSSRVVDDSSSSSGGNSSSSSSGGGRARGVTALWVTHRLEELEFADSVSYMEGGRIAFSGSPQEMRRHLRSLGLAL